MEMNSVGYTPQKQAYIEDLIAAEIRAERARQSLSMQELAAKAGFSRLALSRRVNGNVPMGSLDLVRIARALGLPAAEIMRRAEKAQQSGQVA